MQEFSLALGGQDSEYAFQAWRKSYPKSFVINKDGNRLTLHFAGCAHFYGEDSGRKNTESPKYCAVDRPEIDRWAQAHTMTYQRCKDCERRGLL